jgi:hypothetical protein
VTFHALRPFARLALIAAGLDVLTISRRLGHASAAFTRANSVFCSLRVPISRIDFKPAHL